MVFAGGGVVGSDKSERGCSDMAGESFVVVAAARHLAQPTIGDNLKHLITNRSNNQYLL